MSENQKQNKTKNFTELDWPEILERLSKYALSFPAKQCCLDLLGISNWASDQTEAEKLQEKTSEATQLIPVSSLWNDLRDREDIRPLLQRLQKKEVLSAESLHELRGWLWAVESWSHFKVELNSNGASPAGELKHFKADCQNIFSPEKLLKKLNSILTPDGQLSDSASPILLELSLNLKNTKRAIEKELGTLLEKYSLSQSLQEKTFDMREGRYVVPVKVSSQKDVLGTIVDSSMTKRTVYIEPKSLEILNRKISELQNGIFEETYRILKEMVDTIFPFLSEIELSCAVLLEWDIVKAKAQWGREYQGKKINLSNNQIFNLTEVAHPLLWFSISAAHITRNSLKLNADQRALILTGPNTGGKTVFMKMLGLAAVFARNGLLFPSEEEVIIPFFENILVDLGDHQSISKQLSSFSSHMEKIKLILRHLKTNSLILIDEMNSATDPEEGAALSRAFIEEVIQSPKCFLVATTHDPYLKSWAMTQSEIVNAGMEFDENASSPTYRLQVGFPGRSRALETAARLGLPQELIAKARSFLSKQHELFENSISQLQKEAFELENEKNNSLRLNELLKKEREELKVKSQNIYKDLVSEAQDKIRKLLRRYEVNFSQSQRTRKITEGMKEVREEIDQLLPEVKENSLDSLEFEKSESENLSKSQSLKIGDTVWVKKFNKKGLILKIEKESFLIQLDNSPLQTRVSLFELEIITEKKKKSQFVSHATSTSTDSHLDNQSDDLDIRGMRFDEAFHEVDIFIKESFKQKRKKIKIIHGLGTGALKLGTADFLKKSKYVKSYHSSGENAGGIGVTIVELQSELNPKKGKRG